MKRLKLLFISSALALAAGLTACGGDDDPTPSPEPTPTPTPGRVIYNTRWNPGQTFQSAKLGRQVSYSVLVPQEYLSGGDATFPVVYLLHGYGDNPEAWGPGHFDIQNVDAQARTAGQTGPVIYVIPQGWNSYYVNRYDGGFNYMDMLVEELVPMIDRMLPTRPSARYRAVAGYSMGGFGALAMAGKNTSVFGTCIALSPSMNTDAQYRTLGGWDSQWGDIFGGRGTTGDARLTPHYLSLCPLHFFADNQPSMFASQKWYIDCGDDEERLYAGSGELHSLLRDKGIDHEFRVRNGAHTTSYWREGLREGLAVFKAACDGAAYPAVTPLNPTGGATPESVDVADAPCPIRLFKGNGLKSNENTQIVYVEIGEGSSAADVSTISSALAQAMQVKNVAVAVVNSKDAVWVDADVVFGTVEHALGLTLSDSRRHLVGLGDNLNVVSQVAGTGRRLAGVYLYDTNLTAASGSSFGASQYVLDITDMGTNHRAMFNLFCSLRDANAKVEYRVRNGVAGPEGAVYGVASLGQFLFNVLPIR